LKFGEGRALEIRSIEHFEKLKRLKGKEQAPMRYFTIATIVVALVTIGVAQSPSRKVIKNRKIPSAAITIIGTISVPRKTQSIIDMPPRVIAAPVTSEKEDRVEYELSDEGLNKYSANLDPQGRFRLKVNRDYIAGRKLVLLILLWDDNRGLMPLKYQGKNVVFDIDDKTTIINLGKIAVGN